ncbi:MAG: 4-alpha-glucanotransferase [Acidimicrobiia bacterium]|nr:4-alpha-glucanotransferase [Acidimicrobiia bacterium]
MTRTRCSGILLHPTSLPGPYGIGDLGPEAARWLHWLADTGCTFWQILPLGPTGYGDSPYFCFSAFAGNPYLVSPDLLAAGGLLAAADLAELPDFPADRVDFGQVIPWKLGLLDRAFDRFRESPPGDSAVRYRAFRRAQAGWLDDYALFMALKEAQGGGPWAQWPAPLRHRRRTALAEARATLSLEVERQAFRQFVFFEQWEGLRHEARRLGLRIMGDAPMYVAGDSADVWAHPDLFKLDADLNPAVVAGVPPDYFAETGQLWGNPIYDWDRHAADDFAWWISRMRALLGLTDLVRIDHFRAFVNYWEVPAGSPTAAVGRWAWGPGAAFFKRVEAALGGLPIVAEDLGELHPKVPALLRETGLPGMKVMQFAYDGDPENAFLPEHHSENCVVYTGTHDNDTTVGWYRSLSADRRRLVRTAVGSTGRHIAWDLIRVAWASPAFLAVAPLQDVLEIGPEGRMNAPGSFGGNWTWRLPPGAATPVRRERLAAANRAAGRHREG